MLQSNIVDSLVGLIKQYQAMTREESQGPNGETIVEKIRLIGFTAYYVGGEKAMLRLLDDAQNKDHNDKTITHTLDKVWDRIGSWMA